MIKLTEIKRKDNVISCLAYVEDSKEPINLSFDESTRKLKSESLPHGYEYCKEHLAHADYYLESLVGKEIKKTEHTMMWY